MSSHYTKQFGYICTMTPAAMQRKAYVAFTHDGVSYPQDWLDHTTPEMLTAIGAVPRPVVDPAVHQVLHTPEGWAIEPAAPVTEPESDP